VRLQLMGYGMLEPCSIRGYTYRLHVWTNFGSLAIFVIGMRQVAGTLSILDIHQDGWYLWLAAPLWWIWFLTIFKAPPIVVRGLTISILFAVFWYFALNLVLVAVFLLRDHRSLSEHPVALAALLASTAIGWLACLPLFRLYFVLSAWLRAGPKSRAGALLEPPAFTVPGTGGAAGRGGSSQVP
jgi:hypothetical protein